MKRDPFTYYERPWHRSLRSAFQTRDTRGAQTNSASTPQQAVLLRKNYRHLTGPNAFMGVGILIYRWQSAIALFVDVGLSGDDAWARATGSHRGPPKDARASMACALIDLSVVIAGGDASETPSWASGWRTEFGDKIDKALPGVSFPDWAKGLAEVTSAVAPST